MMTGVFSGRGNAGSAEIRSLGLGNDRGVQQCSHGGKMGQYWIQPASMPQVSRAGLNRAGPEQEHRIPQASAQPSCPVTHARCPLVIFAMECASPSDSPGDQGLKLLPLLTQLPHL